MNINIHRSPDPDSSDTASDTSRSLPNDSALFGTLPSHRNSPLQSLRSIGYVIRDRLSPQAPSSTSETESPGPLNTDEEGPSLSHLGPSLFRRDTTNGSPRIQRVATTRPSSVTSDTTSADLGSNGQLSAELSKHRLKKVESTRACVSDTIKTVSRGALELTHGVAELLRGVLPFGLDGAVKLLLNIWDVVEKLRTNQEECLTLVRRCATIVDALYDDIEREVSPFVKGQIPIPLQRIEQAFLRILDVAGKLNEYNWLNRLRFSDEILQQIDDCHRALDDCLRSFSSAILLRVLNSLEELRSPYPSTTTPLPPIFGESHVLNLSAEDLTDTIFRLQREQNRRDRERDIENLKHRARKATRSKSWPLADFETVGGSRHKVEADVNEVEIPFSDILLMHVVGQGPLSRVYKAVWRNEVIAVKIYASTTTTTRNTQDFAANEIEIWKRLKHPNILEFTSRGTTIGASEDTRVEYAISPFLPHGSISSYLRQTQWNYRGMSDGPKRLDQRGIFFDTAKGMEYLHSRRILHGNLKASNVLIDSNLNCLISDLKYSLDLNETGRDGGGEIRYPIRWQAPEVLRGEVTLRDFIDIYAYGVFCTEVLNFGEIPWPYWSDEEVRHGVLEENIRPEFSREAASKLEILPFIEACWNLSPDLRPRFKKITKTMNKIYSGIN